MARILRRHKGLKLKDPTALQQAVLKGEVDEVRRLLESEKVDANACGENGFAPLYLAAQKSNLDIIKLLIEHDADVNIAGKWGSNTPLHAAVSKAKAARTKKHKDNYIKIIKFLLEKGANAFQENNDRLSPRDLARKKTDLQKVFIEHQTKINTQKAAAEVAEEALMVAAGVHPQQSAQDDAPGSAPSLVQQEYQPLPGLPSDDVVVESAYAAMPSGDASDDVVVESAYAAMPSGDAPDDVVVESAYAAMPVSGEPASQMIVSASVEASVSASGVEQQYDVLPDAERYLSQQGPEADASAREVASEADLEEEVNYTELTIFEDGVSPSPAEAEVLPSPPPEDAELPPSPPPDEAGYQALFKDLYSKWVKTVFNDNFENSDPDNQARVIFLRRLLATLQQGDMYVHGQSPDRRIPIYDYLSRGGRVVFDVSDLGDSAENFWNYLMEGGVKDKLDVRPSTHKQRLEPIPVERDDKQSTLLAEDKVRSGWKAATQWARDIRSERRTGQSRNWGLDIAIGGVGTNTQDGKHTRKNDGRYGHVYLGVADNYQFVMVGIENAAPGKTNPETRVRHGLRGKPAGTSAFNVPKNTQTDYRNAFKKELGYSPTETDQNAVVVKIGPGMLGKLKKDFPDGLPSIEELHTPPKNAVIVGGDDVLSIVGRQQAFESFARKIKEPAAQPSEQTFTSVVSAEQSPVATHDTAHTDASQQSSSLEEANDGRSSIASEADSDEELAKVKQQAREKAEDTSEVPPPLPPPEEDDDEHLEAPAFTSSALSDVAIKKVATEEPPTKSKKDLVEGVPKQQTESEASLTSSVADPSPEVPRGKSSRSRMRPFKNLRSKWRKFRQDVSQASTRRDTARPHAQAATQTPYLRSATNLFGKREKEAIRKILKENYNTKLREDAHHMYATIDKDIELTYDIDRIQFSRLTNDDPISEKAIRAAVDSLIAAELGPDMNNQPLARDQICVKLTGNTAQKALMKAICEERGITVVTHDPLASSPLQQSLQRLENQALRKIMAETNIALTPDVSEEAIKAVNETITTLVDNEELGKRLMAIGLPLTEEEINTINQENKQQHYRNQIINPVVARIAERQEMRVDGDASIKPSPDKALARINNAILDETVTNEKMQKRLEAMGLQVTSDELAEIQRENKHIHEQLRQDKLHDKTILQKIGNYAKQNPGKVAATALGAVLAVKLLPVAAVFVGLKGFATWAAHHVAAATAIKATAAGLGATGTEKTYDKVLKKEVAQTDEFGLEAIRQAGMSDAVKAVKDKDIPQSESDDEIKAKSRADSSSAQTPGISRS